MELLWTLSVLCLQTATDSSSNSSQKREPAMHTLAPPNFCETRRHHCILGHFYEQHRPSDHYFLDQVSRVRVSATSKIQWTADRKQTVMCFRFRADQSKENHVLCLSTNIRHYIYTRGRNQHRDHQVCHTGVKILLVLFNVSSETQRHQWNGLKFYECKILKIWQHFRC